MLTIIIIATIASVPGAFLQTLLAKLAANTARAEVHNPLVRRYFHSAWSFLAMMREPPSLDLHSGIAADQRDVSSGRRPLIDVPAHHRIRVGMVESETSKVWSASCARVGREIASCQSIVNVVHYRRTLARVLCGTADGGAGQSRSVDPADPPDRRGHSLYPVLARNILARIALLRGSFRKRRPLASAHAAVSADAVWLMNAASILMRALLALGRPPEPRRSQAGPGKLSPMLGGSGVTEVEVRLAASEAFIPTPATSGSCAHRAGRDPARFSFALTTSPTHFGKTATSPKLLLRPRRPGSGVGISGECSRSLLPARSSRRSVGARSPSF